MILKLIYTLFIGVFLAILVGVFTLLYSVIRGFGTEDNMFRFIIVAIGFVISLVLGYIKFIQPSQKSVRKA
jgi:apolipoprotein N-acyltransferase